MPLLWLDVPDRHDRALIEQDLIALLSNTQQEAIDPPSSTWIGHHADRGAIRDAGIWNVNHTRDVPTGEGLARFIDGVSTLDAARPTRA